MEKSWVQHWRILVTAKTLCPQSGLIHRAATVTQLADLLLGTHMAMEPLTV